MTDPATHDEQWTGHAPLLADRFVSLADTLVDDFDVVDLMDQLVATSVELLGTEAAGLLLRDPRGTLQLIASSSEESRLLELFQLQNREGPCLDCVSSGKPVAVERISAASGRWPHFVPEAGSMGFLSVYAVPLRLRDQVIGGLNLFRTADPPLTRADQRLAQALADIATIGLLQQRAITHATVLAEQLQHALNSRVVVEQAKGVLAATGGVAVDTAFGLLRGYARSSNQKLSVVAESVVRRRIDVHLILTPRGTSNRAEDRST
jgi:GAF domain-containing protein